MALPILNLTKYLSRINFFVQTFLTSPQTVSDGAVCLRKFHWLLHNVLIINIDKFLQRGRILTLFE